jgi:hypothetical protein
LGQEGLGEKWGTLGFGTAAAHCGGKCGHGDYWQTFGEAVQSYLQNWIVSVIILFGF